VYVFRGEGLTQDGLSEFLGGHPVLLTSDLIEEVVPRLKEPRQKVRIKRFVGYTSWRNDGWDDRDVDVSQGGYYVRLSGTEVVGGASYNAVSKLVNFARKEGIIGEEEIYGIPRTLKSVEKKPGWFDLMECVKSYLAPQVEAMARAQADHAAWENHLDLLVQFLIDHRESFVAGSLPATVATEAKRVQDAEREYTQMLDVAATVGLTLPNVESTLDPSVLLTALREKYPMLTLVSSLADRPADAETLVEHRDVLVTYLSK
jgi:hypothetical protein